MTTDTQLSCIAVDEGSYGESEQSSYSPSFPGLETSYTIDEVAARVFMNEVDASTLHRISLPDGQSFAFSRWEPAKGPGEDDLIITHKQWRSAKDLHPRTGAQQDGARGQDLRRGAAAEEAPPGSRCRGHPGADKRRLRATALARARRHTRIHLWQSGALWWRGAPMCAPPTLGGHLATC